MNPYYDDGLIKIYNGNNQDILPSLPKPSLVLTDPPYGINLKYDVYDDTISNWKKLFIFIVNYIKTNSQMGILPSCQIKELAWIYKNHPPDWLICWYKGSPGHCAYIGFNDWEPLLVYGKTPKLQMHDHFFVPPERDKTNIEHPCPKPLKWASWLISRTLPQGGLVYDPFMGSGTTLCAAKQLGCPAVGIDISEKYCEIAANRLEAQRRGVTLKQQKTNRPTIFEILNKVKG